MEETMRNELIRLTIELYLEENDYNRGFLEGYCKAKDLDCVTEYYSTKFYRVSPFGNEEILTVNNPLVKEV